MGAAVARKVPIMTTLAGANAALLGIKAMRDTGLSAARYRNTTHDSGHE